jgi:hypothetical protein
MKFKEYYDKLTALLQEKPEYAHLTVVYASDDEGNDFQEVTTDPGLGIFWNKNFEDRYLPLDPDNKDEKPNAVCIN